MSQYFENDPNLKSNTKQIKYTFYGKEIIYKVDLGVFSKDRVDFGSNLLLQSLPSFTNESILDVGCGYGTIGLSIAKAYADTQVMMCDVNMRAIELTQNNIDLNKLSNAKVIESNCYEKINCKYDVIISNPPIRAGKKVVHEICLGASQFLKIGGKVYFVIQKKQGADSLYKKMLETYNKCEIINKKNGYLIIEGVM